MPYDDPFAADDGLPDFDPRQATKDMQLQRMKQQVHDNPWALGSSAGPPGKPPTAFLSNPAPRPQDPLTPVYEALSPSQQGYGMGQAIGETIKAPTLWEKAQAAFPLIAGMAIPGAPKGAGGRGVKVRPEIPRELDPMGFYSQALEAAKAWPQPKGTPEQVLAALKQAGVKDAEISATNLRPFLDGKPQVTREELVSHLRDNRVQLNENRYGNAQHEVIRSEDGAVMDGPFAHEADAESRRQQYRGSRDMFVESNYPEGVKGDPKWADYSLDPSNPSYRESVLHLQGSGANAPAAVRAEYRRVNDEINSAFSSDPDGGLSRMSTLPRGDLERIQGLIEQRDALGKQMDASDFRSGHWDEPNAIAHMRTSVQKDTQGKPVFLVDELQSDWGQKLRDGGARDEAKIAELKRRKDEAFNSRMTAAQEAFPLVEAHLRDKLGSTFDATFKRRPKEGRERTELDIPSVHTAMDWLSDLNKYPPDVVSKAGEFSKRLEEGVRQEKLLEAELRTAEAATPGHPLVNTTDQWVTTAQRRLLQQAVEAKAGGIAITPGQLQNERFNLSNHISGLRYEPGREGGPFGQSGTLHFLPSGVPDRGWHSWKNVHGDVTPQNLHEHVGKEVAERLLAQPAQNFPTTSGTPVHAHHVDLPQGMEIGGHGMRYAYDQMYPKALEKQLRKLDPEYPGRGTTRLLPEDVARDFEAGNVDEIIPQPRQVDPAALAEYLQNQPGYQHPFHYFPITDRVREAVAKGLPLFSSAALMALIPQAQPKRPELDERAPFGYDQ